MLYQFVRRLQHQAGSGLIDPRRVYIHVFDRQPVAGPGFPHNEHFVQPYHITNMCAGEMSVIYSRPGDFVEWVESRHSDLVERFPAYRGILCDPAYHQNGCSHYPRALMGEYLKARFQDALRIAEGLGTRVVVHTECEITKITQDTADLTLQAQFRERGSTIRFSVDKALLATGHWPRTDSAGPGYFPTPWPAHRLMEKIPPGAAVAVIGSSLSAIETALTLTSDGRFIRAESGHLTFEPSSKPRRVTLLSRHGLLPRVRSRISQYQPLYFNQENLRDLLTKHAGSLDLDTIFHLLDRELTVAAEQMVDWRTVVSPPGSPMSLLESDLRQARSNGDRCGGVLWQSILRQILPMVRELYLALSTAERKRFDRNYATLFFAHAATQPPVNAEKVLALMRAGVLEIIKLGTDYQLNQKAIGQGYEFTYGTGEASIAAFRHLVDARGQERSVRTDSSPLTRNLIQNGTIHLRGNQDEESGGIDIAAPLSGEMAKRSDESVWIDPDSHRVMQISHSGTTSRSKKLYAIGAMTRGQIIDVSMARALTRSTDCVAGQLIDWLADNRHHRE